VLRKGPESTRGPGWRLSFCRLVEKEKKKKKKQKEKGRWFESPLDFSLHHGIDDMEGKKSREMECLHCAGPVVGGGKKKKEGEEKRRFP